MPPLSLPHTTWGNPTLFKTNLHYKRHKMEHALLSFRALPSPHPQKSQQYPWSTTAGLGLTWSSLARELGSSVSSQNLLNKSHLNSKKGLHLWCNLLLQLALLWLSHLPFLVLRSMKCDGWVRGQSPWALHGLPENLELTLGIQNKASYRIETPISPFQLAAMHHSKLLPPLSLPLPFPMGLLCTIVPVKWSLQ